MYENQTAVSRGRASELSTNKVLRNTYALLSLTLLFSGLTAGLAMVNNWPPMNILVVLVGFYGLMFLTTRFRNSALGLVFIFAFTGFTGATVGPIINLYLHAFSNGGQLVTMALGGTGVIFLGLSGYALVSRRDFSFMGGFLMIGILVAFLAGIGAFIFHMPSLMLAVSAMFILLMSGLILFQTSQIIHGGERNYIMATITLYVAIYNLFLSLLQILGALSGRR